MRTLHRLFPVLPAVLLTASYANAGVTEAGSALSAVWPGTPTVTTYAVPNQPETAASIVAENFNNTRSVSQTFAAPSNFKLGSVTITGSGGGGDSYSVHLFDVSGGSLLPGNYKPSTDGPNPGVDLLTGPTFAYPGSADQFITLTFDSADQPNLISGHLYALEIWPTASVGTSGMLWNRGGAGISTYAAGRAYETTNQNGNTSPFYAPTNFRTPLAGGDRDAVLAVYAAVPEPATLGLVGLAIAGLAARRRA